MNKRTMNTNEGARWSIKISVFLLAFIFTVTFPYVAFQVADYMGAVVNYPQFSWAWDTAHHMVQMLLAIGIMVLPFWNRSLSDWGFNLKEKSESLRIVKKFCIGYIIFLFIGKLIYQILLGWPPIIDISSIPGGIVGKIVFRFTLVGLSEEILFRALIVGLLLRGWSGHIKLGNLEIPIAGMIAALFFSLAHVGFSLFPFQIVYCDPMQLIFAFVFGVFYAILLDKTKSLLAPILVHNAIDGFGTVIDILLTVISP